LGEYYKTGILNPAITTYNTSAPAPNIQDKDFALPFPDTDLTMNPNLLKDPVEFDLTTIHY
jgi:hypothetical protein